jgi:putative transposase
VATTYSDHDGPIYPNLAREFLPDRPDQLWVGDLIYIAVTSRFVYLAALLDAWSPRVVGYAISRRIDAILGHQVIERHHLERRLLSCRFANHIEIKSK